MSALLDLAARVEAASAGTRGLDRMVSEAIGRTPAPRHRAFDGPRYTASIDAAMTLVPEDFYITIKGVRGSWFADLNPTPAGQYGRWTVNAATPALALCAAALRARASCDSGRHAERGDANAAPSEGRQSGGEAASPNPPSPSENPHAG